MEGEPRRASGCRWDGAHPSMGAVFLKLPLCFLSRSSQPVAAPASQELWGARAGSLGLKSTSSVGLSGMPGGIGLGVAETKVKLWRNLPHLPGLGLLNA